MDAKSTLRPAATSQKPALETWVARLAFPVSELPRMLRPIKRSIGGDADDSPITNWHNILQRPASFATPSPADLRRAFATPSPADLRRDVRGSKNTSSQNLTTT
jgi:hypothetical protein